MKIAEEKAFATQKVAQIIGIWNTNKPDHHMNNYFSIPADVPRELLDRLHWHIELMLYSSGFFCSHEVKKVRDKYKIHIRVEKMTPREEAEIGKGFEKDLSEDPAAMD
jgi:hypothetical protein